MVCDAHLVCCFIQANLEPAGGEKWPNFFNAAWHREAFHRLGFQDVTEFDSD
jgi:hypothetical protein